MAQIDYQEVERFAGLFTSGDVPRFPQSREDLNSLNITQAAKVKAAMPELWSRLHAGAESQLPADVMLRLHRNELKAGDIDSLRSAGFEAEALKLEADVREGQVQASFKKMQQEMEEREARREQAKANAELSRMESLKLQQLQAKNRHGAY